MQPASQTAQAQPICGNRMHLTSQQKAHQEQGYEGLEDSLAQSCRILNSIPALNLTFPKKVRQGGSSTHEVVHILTIVVTQTKELLYISDTGRRGPFTNSRQLGWVCVDLAMANYVAQVIDLTLKKCIFLYLCI